MSQKNIIKKKLNHLFHTSIQFIKNNVSFFFSIIAIHLFIIMFFILINQVIYTYIPIYDLKFGIILLRFSLFCLMTGVWVGYFKIILSFIDCKNYNLTMLLQNFNILPKILAIRFISYLSLVPFIIYLLNQFPYDINQYGTNIEQYMLNIFLEENITSLFTC